MLLGSTDDAADWTSNAFTGWGLGEHYQAAPDNNATLNWEFAGLANATYYVAANWAAEPNRTDLARYPDALMIWMAGGGVKSGLTYGASDEFGFNVAEGPVHVHDLQATILHLMGIDHEALTSRFQGRNFRLTDVHGHVVDEILS